jgi:F-type H+-transporting ATPase subunit delta
MATSLTRRAVARYVADQLVGGADATSVITQLAAYLVVQHKTKQTERYLDDIEVEIAARGVVVADVTTARPLSEELRQSVEKLVATQTGGRHVALREHVDRDIIGGMIIRSAGTEYDRSIKRAVRALRGV